MLNIKDCEKNQNKTYKNIGICVKVSKEQSKFLKEKNISPTRLFNLAIKEIGFKELV